jgi:hypothetical protein
VLSRVLFPLLLQPEVEMSRAQVIMPKVNPLRVPGMRPLSTTRRPSPSLEAAPRPSCPTERRIS